MGCAFSVAGTAAVGPLFATLDPRTELDSEERDDAGAVLFPSDDGVEGPADVSALLVVVFAFLFDFTVGKHVHGNGVWVSTGRVGVVWWGVGGTYCLVEKVLVLVLVLVVVQVVAVGVSDVNVVKEELDNVLSSQPSSDNASELSSETSKSLKVVKLVIT